MDILLVEDEPQLAGLVSRALVRAGHSVEIAGDGPHALDAVTGKRFDLVLLDVNLPEPVLRVGPISMDVAKRRVTRGDERVELSPREFEVLTVFMREPGRTFSRDEICERIWEREHEYDTRTVEIFIMRLRKKLDRPGAESVIGTVRGVGYVMQPPR